MGCTGTRGDLFGVFGFGKDVRVVGMNGTILRR